jgi:uncharacterized protein (TIGR03067 family)
MKTPWLLLISAVFLVAAGPPPASVMKEEMDRLAGNYYFSSINAEGQRVPPANMAQMSLSLDGNKLVLKDHGDVNVGIYEVDPRTEPKLINFGFTQGSRKGEIVGGIYSFNNDSLRLALGTGGTRPTDYTSKSGQLIWVLTRKKP